MAKRQHKAKRSVLPGWLSGFSDEEGAEANIGGQAKHLRLIFCDNAGMRRCRVVPLHRLKKVEADGVGITQACMGLGIWGDTYIPDSGLGCEGEVRLMPDVESQVVCPWHPLHEIVLADFHSAPGQAWDHCPRSALRKVLESIEKEYALTFRIGQETEFYVLGESLLDEPSRRKLPEPVDTSLYCQSWAFDNVAGLMDDISEAVESLSIPVEQLHAESGPGQFEIAVAPAVGLQAADNVIFTREAIESVSRRHGLIASFLPKPNPSWAGSGAHTHFSIQDEDGKNLMGELLLNLKGEGSVAESFVAGILKHLPALLIFTLPSPNSYARLQKNSWSGVYRVWGVLNKESPLRLCPGLDDSQTNVEVKSIDSTCNPYLAYAAIIVAGMQGVKSRSRLPPQLRGNPADKDSAELLPTSLETALAAYSEDQGLQQALERALGKSLLSSFVAVRQWEDKIAQSMSAEERDSQLLRRY